MFLTKSTVRFGISGLIPHCQDRLPGYQPLLLLAVLMATASVAGGQEKSVDGKTTTGTLLKKVGELADRYLDSGQDPSDDAMREMQSSAMRNQSASWGHWGNQPNKYSAWTNHSNRLVPLYTFGWDLSSLREQGSLYADAERLSSLFGHVPKGTLNPHACYHDQTDVYELQRQAVAAGKRHIIVMIFDGMDWQTTRAAAIYKNAAVQYDSGRGRGLAFQDYRGTTTDFALIATTSRLGGAKPDVDAQRISGGDQPATGGFDPELAGPMPWHEQSRSAYPIGKDRQHPHTVTDSAASATSLLAGIKTYNGSINVATDGTQSVPIARQLQQEGFRVGIVTSVPISHATPASAYANNVSRKDYQDITRDLLGLPSASHRDKPLPGLDVVIGGGYGEGAEKQSVQGENYLAGNSYMHQSDRDLAASAEGKYVLAQPIKDRDGGEVLMEAVHTANKQNKRLLGFFGTRGGHLPFQTADGDYQPTFDVKGTERYDQETVLENPTLAEMSTAALEVLAHTESSQDQPAPFWLLIEPGDVDWANHANNLDNSIGAVLSGEAAFESVIAWVEKNQAWDDTAIFVTSDHGHYLVLEDAEAIANAAK